MKLIEPSYFIIDWWTLNIMHRQLQIFCNIFPMGAGIARWLERQTRDRKVASLNPGRSRGRIFFSRVNFVCWLLFGVRSPFGEVFVPGHVRRILTLDSWNILFFLNSIIEIWHSNMTCVDLAYVWKSKTHKRLKECFSTGRNRTKRGNFQGNPLFQATYNIKT